VTTERARLMIPGPVDVEDDVLQAMAQQVRPHYGDAWLEIYSEVIERLSQVFGTQHDLFLMTGPGTAALDAALGSLLRTGDKVLVARNGFFGDRLVAVARAYGIDVRQVAAPLGQPIDPQAVRQALSDEPGIEALAVVHLETSTAVLNPVQAIAAAAREFEVPVVVDAVSSLGGVPLPVDEWSIDICVSVINKCLACPSGVAPISISPRAWDQVARKGERAHGWYLNLGTWKEYAEIWSSWHPYPTTLPTNIIYALLIQLRRIMDGGLEAHFQRFRDAAQMVRSGLDHLGFEFFTPESCTSPLLTAVRGLPGMDVEDLRRYLVDEWQIMVSGGLGELRGKLFRVGHVGKASSPEYVNRFLEGTEAYLRLQGLNSPPNRGGR
jgi:alanine-glyoxylate transaminase/serine-glyoxylate transaminase/serine-pyruvate transaminase